MTNREKYGEQVLDILSTGTKVAVVKGKPRMCKGLACHECDLPSNYPCHRKLGEWLNAEYVESQVDWSKVAVDTRILVRDSGIEGWRKRHFAKYDGKFVYAWEAGTTSWSADIDCEVTLWKFAKLAEDEE